MVDFSQTYDDAGKQYNIDPLLLRAVAQAESGERTLDDKGNLITSSTGAKGWMQFVDDTAKQYKVDVNSPTSSIFGGAHYLSDLLDHTKGDLPAALALYNGSLGDPSQTYATKISANYQKLQADRQAALRAGGVTSEAQPTPGVIEITGSGKPPAPPQPNVSGRVSPQGAPDDFGAIFGDKGAPAAAPPASAAPAPAAAPAPDDFGAIFGGTGASPPAVSGPQPGVPIITVRPAPPAVTAPAPTPAVPSPGAPPAPPAVVAAPALPAPAPNPLTPPAQAPTQPLPAPSPAPPAPAFNLLAPSAQAAPVAPPVPLPQEAPPAVPPAPNWLERNIGAPIHAMIDPTAPAPPQNYLLNVPLLQEAGAGIVQGTRDVAQTLRGFGDYVDARIPALAALDHNVREATADASWPLRNFAGPEVSTLPEQSHAFEKQYGSDIPAQTARIGSGLITTLPVGWVAGGAGALARAAPYVGRFAAPVVSGAVGGGLQNLAVSGGTGQDPLRAAETGAVGGGIVGGTLGMLGRLFSRVLHPADEAIADRLGIRLSAGQRAGSNSIARHLEDTTDVVPGSGAARFADEQRRGVTRVLAREAGIPGPVEHIDTAALNAAERNAGNLIQNAAQRITVPGRQLAPNLVNVLQAAQQAGPGTQQAYTARNLVNQLTNLVTNNAGSLPGPEFAAFIRRGGALDTALSSSVPEVRAVGTGIREALFNAAANSGTAARDAIQDLGRGRYQWKVIQTVRPAIARTAAGTDEMSLPALAQAIRNEFNMRMTGAGADMQDLSRLISGPLRALKSSGTAERSLWQRLLGLGTLGTGAGAPPVAWALGHPQAAEALLTGAGVATGGVLAGRLSRFGPGLGSDVLGAAQQELNPLAPRLFGPRVGRNLLQPDQQPAP